MLTSAGGAGVWRDKERAETVRDTEFGGEDHLEVVKVTRENATA